MDFISNFTTAMVNSGIIPRSTHDISEVSRFRRIRSESDKPGKKSISYWLKIERDFAYGYAKDFKTGVELRYNSARNDPDMTRADLERVKAMLKARQAEEDIRIAERHQKIAIRAAQKWAQASETGTTDYLTRKKISLVGAKIYGTNTVMVPVQELVQDQPPQLVAWQMIESDGKKQFPFGGKKTGCGFLLRQINPTRPIVICEGYATAVSLFNALGPDFNITGAFDAGNLLPWARNIRKIYKNTPIIIAADHDPAPHYTGQTSAAKVKKSVADVSVVMPPEPGTDFNDLQPDRIKTLFGLQAESAGDDLPVEGNSQLPSPAAQDWQSNLILDQKNRVVSASLQNAILYMLYHQDFAGVFAYDEFKQDTILLRCPPWQYDQDFKVESITDIHITQAAATLERYGISCTIDKTAKAIDVVAHENRFHSARQYFESIANQWDGVIRLETLAQDLMGCTEESPEYLAFVLKKWMTAAVKRVMEPGCKFDHVLILESQKQGLYKSDFLKCLATFNGEKYHSDSVSISDIGSKDCIMKMQGNLIIELAELSGFNQKDDNAIKNWITQTVDEVRIPFSRKIVIYPRQFVLSATTNNYDYLKDPTGNRRYWPITIGHAIDVEYLEEIKPMLWAEAVWYYKDGLYIGPTPEENELAEVERSKRIQSDAWEDMVMSIVEKMGQLFRTTDVMEKMQLKTYEKNDQAIRRVSTILKQNGYNNSPVWDSKLRKTVRVWSKGDQL